MQRTVYIVNRSSHDFSAAEDYGKLVYVTEGRVNRFATNDMVRIFSEAFKNSQPTDLIVLCSLSVMNSIACAVFAVKHRRLNLLLWKDKEGKYIERNHVL